MDRWAYLSWWRRTGGGQVELVELVEARQDPPPPPPPPMGAQRPLAPPPFQNPSLASLTSLAHFCQVLGDILTMIKTTRSSSVVGHHGQSTKLIKPEVIKCVKNYIVYHYIQISSIPIPRKLLSDVFLAPIRGWLGWRRVTRSRELRTWQLVRKSWTLARGVPDPLFFFISRTGKIMPWVQTVDQSTRWWWESKIRFAKNVRQNL